MWNNCCCNKTPTAEEADWCSENRKVKGRFGVAFVAETPCCCPEPIGWQVEFCDTPSKVEQRCMEMIQWANRPPLPRCEPCPPVEVVSPCFPPKCNPCCPTTNPCLTRCSPCLPCGPCGPCLPCNPCGPCLPCAPCSPCEYTVTRQQLPQPMSQPSRRKCSCCPSTSRRKCNCGRNENRRCRCQDSDDARCHCCPRRREGSRRRRDEGRSPVRHKSKPRGNIYDDEIPVKESRQRSKSKDMESSLLSSGNPNEGGNGKISFTH